MQGNSPKSKRPVTFNEWKKVAKEKLNLPKLEISTKPLIQADQNLDIDKVCLPLLKSLFKNLGTQSKHFCLTGSAAHRLQNTIVRNPNDIDILTFTQIELANDAIISALQKAEITILENKEANITVKYAESNVRIQILDSKSSSSCFPTQLYLFAELPQKDKFEIVSPDERNLDTKEDILDQKTETEKFSIQDCLVTIEEVICLKSNMITIPPDRSFIG